MKLQKAKITTGVLAPSQIEALASFGIPLTEVPILEDLVKLLLPQSKYIDVFEEACRKYREIKRRQRIMEIKKMRQERAHAEKMLAMENHGDIISMADGKRYSDKARYRANLKAMGYMEVGNEDTVKEGQKVKKRLAEEQKDKDRMERMKIIAEITRGARIVA